MKILVTGASGFIGLKLVVRLCEAGHQVRTFGRSSSKHASLASYDIEHMAGDITDPGQINAAIQGCQNVFHLAGLVSYRQKDTKRQYGINVLGTRNVMEACLRNNVERVIHTSSVAAMGIPPLGEIGDENIEYNLEGQELGYCDSKHYAELEVQHAFKKGLAVLMLNPGIIFGEGDTHPHHHAIFATMSKGWMIAVPPGGVPFSDINDVIDAHINAMSKGRAGDRYSLVSANLSFQEAALIFSKVFETRPPMFVLPGKLLVLAGSVVESLATQFHIEPPVTKQVAWLSQYKIFFSCKKACEELDFKPTPFQETIKRTAPYYLGLHR